MFCLPGVAFATLQSLLCLSRRFLLSSSTLSTVGVCMCVCGWVCVRGACACVIASIPTLQKAEDDVSKAETGIIFLDEVDKLTVARGTTRRQRDISGEGVQQVTMRVCVCFCLHVCVCVCACVCVCVVLCSCMFHKTEPFPSLIL